MTCCPKFVSSFHVWFRGQDAASEAHHSRNTHVSGYYLDDKEMRYLLTLLIAFIFQSCISPSSEKIETLKNPDILILKDFGLNVSGEIIYQFYQSYGFTDKEEQLIMIVKPNDIEYLVNELPFDSVEIRKMERIDFTKFIKDDQINFEPDKIMQADIRIEAKEYDKGDKRNVFYGRGKYKLSKSDTLETAILYDGQTKLLYVESKKNK